MRFDLESGAPAVAEIHDAGILTRRNNDAWSSCRQSFEVNTRRFVRAVLRPHDREDAEFGKTRFAAKQFLYSLEFLLCEVVGGDNFGRNHGLLLSITFLNRFLDRFAQLNGIYASDVLINNLAFFVVKIGRRQVAAP